MNYFENLMKTLELERRKAAQNLGWEELPAKDQGNVWEKFNAQFQFNPSTNGNHWPSITEPKPSETYAVGHFWEEPEQNRAAWADELANLYQQAFKSLRENQGHIYALDWQHPCYYFTTSTDFSSALYEDWLVPPFPNGDYYIFLSEDLANGFFGHPWEQTICIFGSEFLATLHGNRTPLFSRMIRKNGKPLS